MSKLTRIDDGSGRYEGCANGKPVVAEREDDIHWTAWVGGERVPGTFLTKNRVEAAIASFASEKSRAAGEDDNGTPSD